MADLVEYFTITPPPSDPNSVRWKILPTGALYGAGGVVEGKIPATESGNSDAGREALKRARDNLTSRAYALSQAGNFSFATRAKDAG